MPLWKPPALANKGRGFAVVAGEVRSLAQRSANAAKEIKTLIGASVDKVETGSRLVQEAGTSMSAIVQSVQQVNDIIGGSRLPRRNSLTALARSIRLSRNWIR